MLDLVGGKRILSIDMRVNFFSHLIWKEREEKKKKK
jgi:hypothetical protein